MDLVMSLDILPPALMPRGCRVALQRKTEIALQHYSSAYRAMVRLEAAKHFALADLALSFPALLFVLAVPHAQIDAAALRRAVIAGEPLKALARRAGLPLWLRQLKPGAFKNQLSAVPSSDLVTRQIGNFIPHRAKHQARWLRSVSEGYRWGHDAFALWLAKTWRKDNAFRSRREFRLLALWAWYSTQPETELGVLVQKRWRMDMDRKQAVRAYNAWAASVDLHMMVALAPRCSKFRARMVAGFDFVHLATTAMVADEAMVMRNCLKSYGYDIAGKGNELWSMRRDGASIATLCIGTSRADGLPAIIEIKQIDNRTVCRDVALAARRWFEMHDIETVTLEKGDTADEAVRPIWQRCFKPYWLAKRALPAWLPLSGRRYLDTISL
jgi:hypothetical protein